MDWSWWETGVMVPWADFHPDDPVLLLESGGDKFWAEDLSCVAPGCRCPDAMIYVHRVADRVGHAAGALMVDMRRWTVSAEGGTGPVSPREQQLWMD